MNIILVALLLIFVTYSVILLAYKFFGRVGLFISIPLTIILANIQVVLTIDLAGYVLTLGNIAYASSYLITDILGENYTRRDAQKGVYLGFFTTFSIVLIMNIVLLFDPISNITVFTQSDIELSQNMYESVSNIFGLLPRIAFASLASYLISQSLDVVIFSKLKNKTQGKALWLRNNASTVTSQLLDTIIFTFLAFLGTYSLNVVIQIFITTFIVKFIISICDTPFMYLASYLGKNNKINEA